MIRTHASQPDAVARKQARSILDTILEELAVRDVKRAQFLIGLDAAEWATVRLVTTGIAAVSPAMRSLEDAGHVELAALNEWASRGFSLPGRSLETTGNAREVARIVALLPVRLRRLGVRLTRLGDLERLATLQGLTTLRLGLGLFYPLLDWLEAHQLDWLLATIKQFDVMVDRHTSIELRRNGKKWSLRSATTSP